jgi:hypothetical protein
MDNDSGRGSRSDEPPPLATVRRLDEHTSRSRIAEDDWYETERLTGQITGGARSTAVSDELATGREPTLVLDWRHADPGHAPIAPRRLRESLPRRRAPKVRLRLRGAQSWLQRVGQIAGTMVPEGTPLDLTTPAELEAAGDRTDPLTPAPRFSTWR